MTNLRRVLSVGCFAVLLLTCVSHAHAQSTYELGPFIATGEGETVSQSMSSAFDDVSDIKASIRKTLPDGHMIVDSVIHYEEQLGDTYIIEFSVTVIEPPPQ